MAACLPRAWTVYVLTGHRQSSLDVHTHQLLRAGTHVNRHTYQTVCDLPECDVRHRQEPCCIGREVDDNICLVVVQSNGTRQHLWGEDYPSRNLRRRVRGRDTPLFILKDC